MSLSLEQPERQKMFGAVVIHSVTGDYNIGGPRWSLQNTKENIKEEIFTQTICQIEQTIRCDIRFDLQKV